MARHILSGERPVFFYGQAYMGSLDAYLVAAGFALFGQSVWVIRLVQAVLYTGTIIATVFIGKVAFGSINVGLLAGLFLAVPAVNSTLYTTVSLGGYGEALLLGSLNLLTGFALIKWIGEPRRTDTKFALFLFVWGLIAGIGLWANALSIVFSAPMGLALLARSVTPLQRRAGTWRYLGLAVAGFGFGSLPWWIFAAQNGLHGLVTELMGSAVAVEGGSWLVRIWDHLINLLILGIPAMFGFRPPWEVRWLALPLIPILLGFWAVVAVFFLKSIRKREPDAWTFQILGGVILFFILAFLLLPFGVDPSGRYFLVLIIPLALAASSFVLSLKKRRLLQFGTVVLVIVFNIWGTLDTAFRNPPGITTQFDAITAIDQSRMPELIAFLRQNGETHGYTNYWVAYPLAFLSGEDLIFVPRLPYHADLRFSSRDDRYAPYDAAVQDFSKSAFITTRNPGLDEDIRKSFSKLGVSWQEKKIGDFQVFYQISRKVRVDELVIGN